MPSEKRWPKERWLYVWIFEGIDDTNWHLLSLEWQTRIDDDLAVLNALLGRQIEVRELLKLPLKALGVRLVPILPRFRWWRIAHGAEAAEGTSQNLELE